jgi:glycine/D-amino acid oxidase-like deaminating enzyme
MNRTADIVICGAGITGVAAAHSLSKAGVRNIVLFDERAPSINYKRPSDGVLSQLVAR